MDCDRVFAYGTLRREARPDVHQQFLGDRAEFLGHGTVSGRLWRVSWYPALTQAAADERVVGEVHRLSNPAVMIAELDVFEVCNLDDPAGSEYTREVVTVRMDDGHELSAWCYFFLGSTEVLTHIKSGDFTESEAADSV